MGPSWKIGSVFGIGLYIHWTFLLLPVWTFTMVSAEAGAEAGVFGSVLVLTIFGCVLLHELGHALTAMHFGIRTPDITLYPIGGVARLEALPEAAWEELWIALGGPAVNIVIAAILIPLGFALGAAPSEIMSMHFVNVGAFLVTVGVLNVFPLAALNMIPAFPMDGGRVLRALLQLGLGRRVATEIAAALGLVLGTILMLLGFGMIRFGHPQGVMWILLSGFVMLMGQRELRATRRHEAENQTMPLQVLPADADVIDANALPIRPNFSGYTWDPRLASWVEWRDGLPIHTVRVQSD